MKTGAWAGFAPAVRDNGAGGKTRPATGLVNY